MGETDRKSNFDNRSGCLVLSGFAGRIKPPERVTGTMSVSFDQFQEFDFRIGTIVDAVDHPNADSLYLLDIAIGEDEPRQSVAGIKSDYDPEDLIEQQVVVLANLETTDIRGEDSEVMLLAADEDSGLSLIEPDRFVEPGTTVH